MYITSQDKYIEIYCLKPEIIDTTYFACFEVISMSVIFSSAMFAAVHVSNADNASAHVQKQVI